MDQSQSVDCNRSHCGKPASATTVKQKEDQHSLRESHEDERITQAEQIETENPKSGRIRKIDIAGMNILDLKVQYLTFHQPLRDVRIVALIRRVPEAVVKEPQQERIGADGAQAIED